MLCVWRKKSGNATTRFWISKVSYTLVFFCFFLASCAETSENQTTVAICCIFRDDAKYLPEWIEFPEKQGVSHFYLYNNLSTDNWKELLTSYVRSGLVEIIDWPYEHVNGTDWNTIQCNAYMDGAKRAKGKYQWCAFLDSDEFLFAVDGSKLSDYLVQYKKSPGIMVNWIMYGTSHVPKVPDGEKMVNYLVFRAPLDYEHHRTYKSIGQPSEIKGCANPHWLIYHRDKKAVDENHIAKRPEEMKSVSVNKLRINHYWSRDMDFFYNVKLARRSKWYDEYERTLKLESEMNAEYDPILADH